MRWWFGSCGATGLSEGSKVQEESAVCWFRSKLVEIRSFQLMTALANVMSLVDATSGTNYCGYDYGPALGNASDLRSVLATVAHSEFQRKFTDTETDLLFYGYRFFSASTGQWLSRDSIEEAEQPNTYAFCKNAPISIFDWRGQHS